MKSDVMQAAGLEAFAEVGLILFVVAFLMALVVVLWLPRERVEHMSELPLGQDEGFNEDNRTES